MNKISVKLDKYKRIYINSKLFFIRNGWKKAEFLRRKKIFHYIGDNCYYHPTVLPAEPYLVSIHNNVVISSGVRLITHSSLHEVFNHEENTNEFKCRFGKIEIFDNVYIGADAIINYGVNIGKNSIIAAGAVVTKDVPEGSVVAGIPAKVIGNYKDSKEKARIFSKQFSENTYYVSDMVKEIDLKFER